MTGLRVDGVTRATGGRNILEDVSFAIPGGAIATILGPSGSGKTTLLRLVMGLESPDRGEVHLDGRCLARPGLHIPPERRGMSLVFQEFTLFPHLDVAGNLALAASSAGSPGPSLDELLELLEIGHLKRRRIDRLSGGEQQRVALARSLAAGPRVLLLDEPFSNIDHMLRDRLFERLRQHLRTAGITSLIATHDHKEAFYFSDTILVLRQGRLLDQNPPRRIYEQPADPWVARFFGEANLLTGAALQALADPLPLHADTTYLVRPEAFALAGPEEVTTAARVTRVVYYGAYQDVRLALDEGPEITVRCAGPRRTTEGERVGVALRPGVTPHPLA